jgi:hypothetical protein
MRCAAATANTRTNGTKMTMHQQNGRGLLASKDSRTRIKVVRKGAEKACVGIRCNASKNPSDGGKKGGKSGIAGEKVRGGKRALQNKAVSEPPSSQGRQSDLTPAFISPSQFTEMQLSTSQMKNLASQRPRIKPLYRNSPPTNRGKARIFWSKRWKEKAWIACSRIQAARRWKFTKR